MRLIKWWYPILSSRPDGSLESKRNAELKFCLGENEAPSVHRMKSFFLFTLWAWAKVYSVDDLNSLVGFLTWMGYR